METKDLMVGDWFNFLIDIEGGDTEYDPKNEIYQPMQIVNLTAWGNNDGEVESAEGVLNDIDQLQPIPLTSEILRKNGFQQISINEYVNGKVIISILVEGFLITIKSGNARVMITLKHVHELQHALRLCGINKEITI